jgi:hypothetical protein
VFYISKVALFETFKNANKLSVDCVNDLVISFYEIKREKARSNRLKKLQNKEEAASVNQQPDRGIMNKTTFVSIGSIAVGIVLAKMLFF